MSSFESMPIHHGQRTFERPGSDIKKKGYLRKLKTMKKKFFVLRGTSSSGPARLEYYDSEKKFNLNQPAKRSIDLHTCFNINKRVDIRRHNYAIALYTKDDCFTVLAENKTEQDDWLTVLLEYQLQYVYHDENREHFEHVWQVNIKPKGLALQSEHKQLRGCHRLCLSSQNICIVKLNTDKPIYVFQLATVRSLGISDCLFRMEVGTMAATGQGELWMQVEDSGTAHTMHDCIYQCMKAASSVVEVDLKIKERTRSGTVNSTITPRSTDHSRSRTNTFGASDSPSRIRSKPNEKRPVSCSPNVSISVPGQYNTLSSTSPLFNLDYQGHRLRSDSAESRASRRSKHDEDFDYFSGMNDSVDVISEEGSGQASLDFTSLPSSPSQLQEHLKMSPEEEGGGLSTYMVMNPGLATPPTVSHNSSAISSYMDMTTRPQRTSGDASPGVIGGSEGYLNMSLGRPPASSPIPIRGPPEVLYKDMTCHTSHLPTVTEGGSNEGYLPMSPTSAGHSSFSSDHLKPEPAICMLAEDTAEFPKRTYSLGSKPPVSTANKNSGYLDMTINKGVADKGRSCSAPHLIPNRKIHMDSPTPSASPLSTSMRSDDSESFMEIDFYRPRTASDSFSYRPRASSFGNKTLQQAHGHRPRSSSHGQQARVFRTKAFESARTTSEELRQSMNSCRGSADSLKMSSSESLRKLSREVRAKTSSLLSTDYLDMSIDKRKTPSPQPSYISGQKPNGYVDMTLGNRSSSPSHCRLPQERSGSFSGNFNKARDKVMQERSGSFSSGTSHRIMPVSEISSKKSHSADVMHKTSTSSLNEMKGDKNDLYMNMDMSSSQTSNESRKSDKDSRSSSSENLESYVMYEPKTTTNTNNTSSSNSSKKSSHRPMSESFRHVGERPIRKDPRRKSSHLPKSSQWYLSHQEQSQFDKNDEYIEFSPMGSKSLDPNSNMVAHQRQHSNPKTVGSHSDLTSSRPKSTNKSVETSDYIGFAPGQIGSNTSDHVGYRTPENGDSSEYMGFEPGNIGVKPEGDNSEYMGYEPGSKNTENGKSSPVASQMVVQKSYFGSTSSAPKTNKKSGQVKSKSALAKDENEYLNFEPAASVDRKNKENNSKTQNVKQKSNSIPAKSMVQETPKTVAETKPVVVPDDYLLTEKLETSSVSTTTPIPVPINPPCIISVEDGNSKKVVKSPVQKKGSSNSLTSGQDGVVVKDTKIPARHSLSDLSGYEQMSFQTPNIKVQTKQGSNSSVSSAGVTDVKTLTSMGSPSNIVSSMCNLSVNVPITTNTPTQLLANDECLNYAKLDLGSSENVGEDGVRSPRIKSRHASAAEEKSEPLSYAEIDFEKSENMKTLTNLKFDN